MQPPLPDPHHQEPTAWLPELPRTAKGWSILIAYLVLLLGLILFIVLLVRENSTGHISVDFK